MIDFQHGEQPLKRLAVRRTQESNLDPDDVDAADDDNPGTALYAPYQTVLYTAPTIVDGRIPRNVYGNLDVYVPSMVPRGGVHIPHSETARAARIIGIDYADAVTGFSFKGRHGTAIMNGAVVAAEHREAVQEVIKAFEDERAQAEEERRSVAALKLWKRFLVGLRIRERIQGYNIEGEHDAAMSYEMGRAEDEDEENNEGGGFLPDRDADRIAQPTALTVPMRDSSSLGNDDGGGGFCMSEDEQEEVEASRASDPFFNGVNDADGDDSGGFELDNGPKTAGGETSDKNKQETSHGNNYAAVLTSLGIHSQERFITDGGFLPDDDDMREDAPPAEDSKGPLKPVDGILEDHDSIDTHDIAQIDEQSENAFSDLPAGELEEARTLQQLYELQGSRHYPMVKEDVTVPSTSKSPEPVPVQGTTAVSEEETPACPKEEYPSNERVEEEDSAPDSSEEDRGSLLSHDPDDEDADPEWLA